ncbi:hypothetical protein [Neorhizobium sp. LjRoot104]|uniref:hypothetical protein n=1 Tax=Neorhizobium sp. LjRoot104 TaxID=3342254 RepID=UPI003ECE0945
MAIDPNKRIIYQNDDGGVSIITPCDYGSTIHKIAAKDVPTGRPYKIINVTDIPADRSQRIGWIVDEADLTDGVGA